MHESESDQLPPVVPLALATQGNFDKRRGRILQALWMVAETAVLNNSLIPSSGIKVALLKMFGARIGAGCVCPHAFRVKYPWNLTIGNDCWIGTGSGCTTRGSFQSAPTCAFPKDHSSAQDHTTGPPT